jgi:hypothetical protein
VTELERQKKLIRALEERVEKLQVEIDSMVQAGTHRSMLTVRSSDLDRLKDSLVKIKARVTILEGTS